MLNDIVDNSKDVAKIKRLIKRLENADGDRDLMVSSCCGAIVYEDMVICPVCNKKYETITETEFEEGY